MIYIEKQKKRFWTDIKSATTSLIIFVILLLIGQTTFDLLTVASFLLPILFLVSFPFLFIRYFIVLAFFNPSRIGRHSGVGIPQERLTEEERVAKSASLRKVFGDFLADVGFLQIGFFLAGPVLIFSIAAISILIVIIQAISMDFFNWLLSIYERMDRFAVGLLLLYYILYCVQIGKYLAVPFLARFFRGKPPMQTLMFSDGQHFLNIVRNDSGLSTDLDGIEIADAQDFLIMDELKSGESKDHSLLITDYEEKRPGLLARLFSLTYIYPKYNSISIIAKTDKNSYNIRLVSYGLVYYVSSVSVAN